MLEQGIDLATLILNNRQHESDSPGNRRIL